MFSIHVCNTFYTHALPLLLGSRPTLMKKRAIASVLDGSIIHKFIKCVGLYSLPNEIGCFCLSASQFDNEIINLYQGLENGMLKLIVAKPGRLHAGLLMWFHLYTGC